MLPTMKHLPRALRAAAFLPLVLVAGGSAFEQDSKPAPGAKLTDLSFFTGTWRMKQGDREIEETWIPIKAGAMFGISRTTSGEKTTEFEFLRVEQRNDDIYYVAQPGGSRPTPFKLVKAGPNEVLFENPKHDFPSRISYSKRKDGALVAWIDGPEDKPSKRMTFEFQPVK
jgi:hypothetical protein